MQAYEGYFENGQFYASGQVVSIPERRRTIVILDDKTVETENYIQKHLAAFDRFISANKALDEEGIEPLDGEFDAILSRGIRIARELDL